MYEGAFGTRCCTGVRRRLNAFADAEAVVSGEEQAEQRQRDTKVPQHDNLPFLGKTILAAPELLPI